MKTVSAKATHSVTSGVKLDIPDGRLHYIDWLRVLAVLLLFPFHTLRVFNANDPFYVKAAHTSGALSDLLNFISVWHMPLLFVLAGASTYFALGKRSPGQYLRERRLRLAIPFVFGVLVLIPPQTWYGGRFNSGYVASFWHYLVSGDFLKWNIKNGGDYYGGFGIGHLWFIIILLLLSVIALPLFWWGRNGHGAEVMQRFSRRLSHPAGWALAALLTMIGAILPNPAGLRPFYYLVFFVLGYVVVCDAEFMRRAEKYRLPALALGVLLALWWTLRLTGRLLGYGSLSSHLAKTGLSFLVALASWLVIVGLLGYGRRYLNHPSPALAYLAQASYPIYILQQTVIVVAAFYIVGLPAAEPLQWLTLFVSSVAGTFVLYEAVRRFPVSRFLFGMRPLKKRAAEESRSARPAAAAPAHSSGR